MVLVTSFMGSDQLHFWRISIGHLEIDYRFCKMEKEYEAASAYHKEKDGERRRHTKSEVRVGFCGLESSGKKEVDHRFISERNTRYVMGYGTEVEGSEAVSSIA